MQIKYSNSWQAPLWVEYVEHGYQATGFIGFARAMCPTATISGTTASGLTFEFDDEQEYTLFVLKWV